MQKSFDFAILGDQQPEGLLLAAGLARRSYKVCVVPSTSLGELPLLQAWPLRWPEKIGKRRLDELLFKVGFFKLEEAGLQPEEDHLQILLKKHRFSFDGKDSTWFRELAREFPNLEDSLKRMVQQLKTPGANPNAAIQSTIEVERENSEVSRLMTADISGGRPVEEAPTRELAKRWVDKLSHHDRHLYRLKPQQDMPYSQFLLEHCRKWGVQVMDEPLQLESKWRHFQISANVKSQFAVINSLGGARQLSKVRKDLSTERMKYWMYFDRIMTSSELVPEPLGEFSYLSLDEDKCFPVLLRCERDRLRDRAVITLGVWLPFQDSRQWEGLIEKARLGFKKLAPFIPESAFRQIPSPLELNEMKGECIRRGELDRLDFDDVSKGAWMWPGFWGKLLSKVSSREKPKSLHSRVMVTAPYIKGGWGRSECLEDCLKAVEFFERNSGKRGNAARAS